MSRYFLTLFQPIIDLPSVQSWMRLPNVAHKKYYQTLQVMRSDRIFLNGIKELLEKILGGGQKLEVFYYP